MAANPLPTRHLGDLAVPAIGFGAMVLSPGMYGDIDEDRALTALRHAIEAGATFVDTSDAYGEGHNESLVGRAIAGRRDDVVVATKFGLNVRDGAERHAFPVAYAFGELAVNGEPRYVRGYAQDSLRRLDTDVIDLYYLHFPDPAVPVEDTAGAVADLVADGLVRHFGLSNVTADELRRAHATHPVTAVQVEWSMWRPIPPDLLAAADELGVGIVAWSPLGGGFLTGTVTDVGDGDFRRNAPRFQGDNLAVNNGRYATVRRLAEGLAITPGQLALAWLLHQHPAVVPIPGSRTPAHIDENIDAARVDLHPDTLDQVDRLLAGTAPAGAALL
ncbi:MAG TPA: aldo/keto reductase [Acidimicrobiales bacterium]|nr:aldo/keto reductase [Acidimicrobiales bacterium]